MKNTNRKILSFVLAAVLTLSILPFGALTASAYSVGDIITFGGYPQSRVTDTATIVALNGIPRTYTDKSLGLHNCYADIMYNGVKYRAMDNGEYYRWEPLQWRILNPDSMLVLCEKSIDRQLFKSSIYSSGLWYGFDYSDSDLRQWLCHDFYNEAFAESEKRSIRETVLANGKYPATVDKIFILTIDDFQNSAYGFNSDPTVQDSVRACNGRTTDYAKRYDVTCSYCWTRSQVSTLIANMEWANYEDTISCVDGSGALGFKQWFYTGYYSTGSKISQKLLVLNGRTNTNSTENVRPAFFYKTGIETDNNPNGGHTIHTYNDGSVTTPATCKKEGVKTFICTACGEVRYEPVPVNPNNHPNTVLKSKIDATCVTDGYSGDTVCADCGKTLSYGVVTQKTGVHTWNAGEVTTAATCKSTGVMKYTCTVCGTTRTEPIAKDMNNHVGDTEIRNARAATADAEGYTGDTYCKSCGGIVTVGVAIPQSGDHAWDGGVVTTAATCKTTGVMTYTCAECGETHTETIPVNPNNHTNGVETRDAKEATCKELGFTGHSFCVDCGERVRSGVVVPKLTTHEWDDGVISKTPTCHEEGEMLYTCTVCELQCTETVEVDIDNHDGGTELRGVKAATCTEDGYTGDTHCLGCGERLTAGFTVFKTGHDYEGPVWKWKNGTKATATFACARGDDTVVLTAQDDAITEEILTEPAIGEEGLARYTATVEFEGVTYTDSAEFSLPALPEPPDESKLCKYCHKDHGATPVGRIIGFFHSILYFFSNLFGKK